MPFLNENVARGLPAKGAFQAGVSDVDGGAFLEQGVLLPAATDPAGSYVYYDCTVTMMLDSGIVVHNRLPQVDNAPDTLASAMLDDTGLDTITGVGVNLKCRDQYTDIVQRMGHARYWFRLWGQALRVAYQIPIPGIKSVGGVAVTPHDANPQMAYNRIFPGGNYGGLALWHAAWSLWYTTTVPPTDNAFPTADAAAHISGSAPVPQGIQAPYSQPDSNATQGVASIPIVTK